MFNFDKAPNRILEKCRKWDKDIIKSEFGSIPSSYIPMWIADMDFSMPETTKLSLIESVNLGVLGYTYVYDEFYDAVINWHIYKNNILYKKEHITLTYGTVSTLHYTIQAFCEKDDYVIMNTPVYSPFEKCAQRQGVKCIYNSMYIENNRYYIDFEMLEEQIKTYSPKIYLLCSPHNPSGRIWSKDELLSIKKLCMKYNVLLVVDEVHSEQINFGSFTPMLKLACENDNIIMLSSPNKAFNLGGLKTSYAIIPNEDLRKTFRARLVKNSITSPNVFGIKALIASYNSGRDWFCELTDYIISNYNYLSDFIENHLPNLSLMKMESSYLAWINIKNSGYTSSEFVSSLANKYGVLLEDGSHFVKDGEGFVRMNLGTQLTNIQQACELIKCFLED